MIPDRTCNGQCVQFSQLFKVLDKVFDFLGEYCGS